MKKNYIIILQSDSTSLRSLSVCTLQFLLFIIIWTFTVHPTNASLLSLVAMDFLWKFYISIYPDKRALFMKIILSFSALLWISLCVFVCFFVLDLSFSLSASCFRSVCFNQPATKRLLEKYMTIIALFFELCNWNLFFSLLLVMFVTL